MRQGKLVTTKDLVELELRMKSYIDRKLGEMEDRMVNRVNLHTSRRLDHFQAVIESRNPPASS